jgi:hypothetical protein
MNQNDKEKKNEQSEIVIHTHTYLLMNYYHPHHDPIDSFLPVCPSIPSHQKAHSKHKQKGQKKKTAKEN